MLLSSKTDKATQAFIDDELDPAHYALLQHMTVKLTGGVANGVFTGTGVVFAFNASKVFVLTAKHNLHIAATGTGLSPSQLANYFKNKISVELSKHGGGTQQAAIASVTLIDGKPEDYNYDVCMLRLDDVSLATQVGKHLDPGGLSRLFASLTWQRNRGKTGTKALFDVFSDSAARSVLAHGYGYDVSKQGFTLLQFGHGKLSDSSMASYGFRKRIISVADVVSDAEYLDKTKEGYQDVYTFPADDTDTALSGDSGGPIFAIDSTGTRSWLIGLHLGANFYKNKIDDDSGTDNNAFTVVNASRLA